MNVLARFRLLSAFVLPLLILPATAAPPSAIPNDKVDALIARLQADGFTVQEGRMAVARLGEVCCAAGSPLDCTYYNAASPYLVAYLPLSPGQTTTEVPFLRYAEFPDLSLAWRLRPDEAVVFVGLTPPPVRYFGVQTYRWFTNDELGHRVRRWNNVGDSANVLTLPTSGTPNGTPGNPYLALTVRITAADRGIDARVREAARRAGFPPSITSTEALPQSILRMGIDQAGDQFNWVIRSAIPADPAALDAYKDDAPARVLRVTPKTAAPVYPATSGDPFPIPGFRAHGTAQTEFALIPAMRQLRRAILDRYDGLQAAELQTEQWLFYGLHHMDVNDDGLAPSSDALYMKPKQTFGTLGDDPDDFVIVYGVNHQRTGKATYMNISVYGDRKHVTADSVDDPELVGTAEEYLPGHPDAGKLYVYKLARHCNGEPGCMEIPYGCCDPETPEQCVGTPGCTGMAADEEGIVGWRAYLDPVSKTAPDPAELIYDRAIRFSPQP